MFFARRWQTKNIISSSGGATGTERSQEQGKPLGEESPRRDEILKGDSTDHHQEMRRLSANPVSDETSAAKELFKLKQETNLVLSKEIEDCKYVDLFLDHSSGKAVLTFSLMQESLVVARS